MLFPTPWLSQIIRYRGSLGSSISPTIPSLHRRGQRSPEMRRNCLMSLKLVNCEARNKIIFCVFEGSPFSIFSLLSSSRTFCRPPLFNNTLEHPKPSSIWEALIAAGYIHQRSRTKSFPHSLLCPEVYHESALPCCETAQQHALSQDKLEGNWRNRTVYSPSTSLKARALELCTEGACASVWLFLRNSHGYKTKTSVLNENVSVRCV